MQIAIDPEGYLRLVPEVSGVEPSGQPEEEPDWTESAAEWLAALDPGTVEVLALETSDLSQSPAQLVIDQLLRLLRGQT